MSPDPPPTRRAFLARIGVLGAAVGTGLGASLGAGLGAGGVLPRSALAVGPDDPVDGVVALLRPVLAKLSHDTMAGLVAFAYPGDDTYSRAQGTAYDGPGGVAAEGPEFMIEALDNFVPFPDQIAGPVAAALVTGLADTKVPLPGPDLLPVEVGTLDRALKHLLENDATLPLSWPIASLLNLLGTTVRPAAVDGPLLSPFARLAYADKARVFELLESPSSDLVALLDAEFPEPLRASVSGLLKFVGGALLEFSAFGSYGEFGVFDPETRKLTDRPVGWQHTGYQPDGPGEGWDEFIGYYQGRQEVHD